MKLNLPKTLCGIASGAWFALAMFTGASNKTEHTLLYLLAAAVCALWEISAGQAND